ncbi:MAG TPA: hypothetical protein VM532_18205 [Burkholderiales bacterium]|nr:hypothetical protein [Burkholderiales bacterium]
MTPHDLTRWNRFGLSRIEYVDGNAAVFLEHLRASLNAAFPNWTSAAATIPSGETEEALKQRIEALYNNDPDDMLWRLTRSFARACHVLSGTLDAYANEGYLGTATQWENLRRLIGMLDYAPHPAASAFTPLVLLFKEGMAGALSAGFQVRYSPTDGGKPLIFETLDALSGDAEVNVIYPYEHDHSPVVVSGTKLTLDGKYDKLKTGEPIVLEDDRDSTRLQAYLIQGIQVGDETTVVTVSPPIARAQGFVAGHTLVHASPKDKLSPIGPATTGAEVGRGLQLTAPATGLADGDVVTIGRVGAKAIFRRIKQVTDDRLVFHHALGEVDLANATVALPITVPIARLGGSGRNTDDDTILRALYIAGDWSWLAGLWLADVRHVDGKEYLPMYECIKARYFPVTAESASGEPIEGDPEQPLSLAGYTAITLAWKDDTDRADDSPDLSLDNPQTLLAPSQSAGPWRPDTFLQKSANQHLAEPVVVSQPKKTAAGDIAVVTRGGQIAWARLRQVNVNLDAEQATLETTGGWQDRGGGPFFLASSKVYSHFTEQAQLFNWRQNDTSVSGSELSVEEIPDALTVGRTVLLDNGEAAIRTSVAEIDTETSPPVITFVDDLPEGSTAGNLIVYGNVVMAGHGETQPTKIIGSGDASSNNQRFLLDASDASFITDATMSSGVKADIDVQVGDESWTQVGNLKDSDPTEAHFQVRQTEDGRLWIEFGDGRNGRRLPTGANNVRATYRKGSGSSGNLAVGSLVKPVKPNALVDSVLQPVAASGGGEREAVETLRENAASSLLALERAVSLSDFAYLARTNAAVAQAQAFALPPGRGQREKIEVVIVPAGGASFTTDLGDTLSEYLLAHALPGVSLTVSAYQPLMFSLRIAIRIRTDAFDGDTVRDSVEAALIAAFSQERRELGQSLYRGEVYSVVEAVNGVENSDCEILPTVATTANAKRIAKDPNGFVLAVHPQPRQCAHLDTTSPQIEIEVEVFTL